MANDRYIQWQLIAPPATRFFQLTDGNFSMYFERTRVSEMVAWAEAQVEAFRRLEVFIEQQTAKVETPASPDDKPLIPPTPKEVKPQAIAPNIKSIPNPNVKPNPNVRPGENQMVQGLMGRGNLVNRNVSPGTLSKSMVGEVGLTTQEAIEEAVPEVPAPKPKIKPDLTITDPGLAIALAQQKRLDESKGIDREAKNSAPDEPSPDEIQEEPGDAQDDAQGEAQGEPNQEEEASPNIITAEETQ
jgi:hypothetical protein